MRKPSLESLTLNLEFGGGDNVTAPGKDLRLTRPPGAGPIQFRASFPKAKRSTKSHEKCTNKAFRASSCVFVDRLLVEVQNQPVPAAGSALETLDAVRIRSTYFAMTSTSRFTSSPGFRCEKFVTSHVFGITAISK